MWIKLHFNLKSLMKGRLGGPEAWHDTVLKSVTYFKTTIRKSKLLFLYTLLYKEQSRIICKSRSNFLMCKWWGSCPGQPIVRVIWTVLSKEGEFALMLSSANEALEFITIWNDVEFQIADNGLWYWLKMILVIVLSKESELQSRPFFLKDKEKFHIKRAFHPNQSTVIDWDVYWTFHVAILGGKTDKNMKQ